MNVSKSTHKQPASFHAVARGRVQGVLFRNFTVKWATYYEVNGTVRNLIDGTVEIVAEGNKGNLEKLISKLSIGPEAAIVTGLDIAWGANTGKFKGFSQIHR